MFSLIAFDADDTLWENEAYYVDGRKKYREILYPYGIPEDLETRLDAVENNNIPYFGYGVNSFIFSLIENAIITTNGRILAKDIQKIIDIGRVMLDARVDLFDHAEPTLRGLAKDYPLMLITKGDLLHQQKKLNRSGLGKYFRYVEVVADKTPEIYSSILTRHNISPRDFIMIGNSMRSDILPVLELGGHAVYIPGKLSWSHEHRDLPDDLAGNFVELEHLGQVENWLKNRKFS